MRSLHPELCCPDCGLAYEHIRSTRKTILHDLPELTAEQADALEWPPHGVLEFLACQHGKAESGPAVGLVPPRPIEEKPER